MSHADKRMPIPAVSAIIVNEKDEVVLVKRKYPPGEGRWALPGGHVEYGETLREAIIREIKEETNYNIEIKSFLFPCTVIKKKYPEDTDPPKYHYIINVFECKVVGGTLKAGTDAIDAKWIPINKTFNLKLTLSTKESLKRYMMRRKEDVFSSNELVVYFYEKM
ncbi:MAG: NUDIX hydrolase [Candidatus Asgardarchaeia archaeon]